jgi:cysteine desulfurase
MSIYLDCNATTPTEPEVVEKIKQYLITDFGNEGSHTHSVRFYC